MSKYEWNKLTKSFSTEWHEKVHGDYYHSAYDTEIVEINGFSLIDDPADETFYFYGKVYARSIEEVPLDTQGIAIPSQELKYDLFYAYQKMFGVKPDKDAQFVILTTYR